jgi:hypothetical protein
MGLLQHSVDKRRFAMVYVGDDGDVSQVSSLDLHLNLYFAAAVTAHNKTSTDRAEAISHSTRESDERQSGRQRC